MDSLLFAEHAIEMFRHSLPDGPPRHRLDQLSNRLANLVDGIFRGSSCLCVSDTALVRDVGTMMIPYPRRLPHSILGYRKFP